MDPFSIALIVAGSMAFAVAIVLAARNILREAKRSKRQTRKALTSARNANAATLSVDTTKIVTKKEFKPSASELTPRPLPDYEVTHFGQTWEEAFDEYVEELKAEVGLDWEKKLLEEDGPNWLPRLKDYLGFWEPVSLVKKPKTIAYVIGQVHNEWDDVSPYFRIYTDLDTALSRYQELGEDGGYDFRFITYSVPGGKSIHEALEQNRHAWFPAIGDGIGV